MDLVAPADGEWAGFWRPMTHLLLDTCAGIWIANGQSICQDAQTAIVDALEADQPVFVSPITAWEIGQLAARGRISLPMSPTKWFKRLLDAPGVRLASMDPELLIASSSLPGLPLRDPADRIIVTTARELRYRIVTRDQQIIGYADQGYCRTLAC